MILENRFPDLHSYVSGFAVFALRLPSQAVLLVACICCICSIPFPLKGFEHVFYPSSIVDTCVSSCFCLYLQLWLELLVPNCPAGKDEGWQKKKEVQDDEEEDAWIHILAVEQSSGKVHQG